MHTDLDTQVSYYGNASTVTAYTVNFPLADASHLVVIETDVDGVETTLTTNDYTFTPTTSGGRITGGSVTTDPAIPATSTLLLKRVTPRTQLLNLTSGGAFGAEAFESALDKLVMIMQEIVRDYGAADTDLAADITALDARVTALEP